LGFIFVNSQSRGHHNGGEEQILLAEDEKDTVQKRIDWSTLVLSSIRDCRDEDTLIFGIQKVVEGLNEVLSSAVPEFRRKLKH
jgi:hypothetical protein